MRFLSFSVYFALSTLLLHAVIATPLPQPTTVDIHNNRMSSFKRRMRILKDDEAKHKRLHEEATAAGRTIQCEVLEKNLALDRRKIQALQLEINRYDYQLRLLRSAEKGPEVA